MSHSFWASSLRTYLGEMQQKSLARQSQPFPGSSDLRNLTPRVAHAPGSATIPESEGPLDNIIPINSPVDNHVPSQVADHLLDIYARLILPVFPIVGGLELRGLVESSTTKGKTYGYECSLKLNLVFAIASRHLLVVHENNLSGGLPNPSVFFSRAYHQNQSPDHFYMEPSLSQVQIAGLTAFYLICINQIDRYFANIMPVFSYTDNLVTEPGVFVD